MKLDITEIKKNKSIGELLDFGIILIDKPSGPTSFEVSGYIREKLHLKRTGHFGTLDPQVSGVLPVALNRACRLSDYFIGSKKKYVGIMRLHETVDDTLLKNEIVKFLGKITQMPPVRSSVKRELREREVYSWEQLERHEKEVLFMTEVEGGTYIRTLVKDMGENIGGAHMLELRRINAGIFGEKECYSLYEFDKAVEAFESGNDKMLKEMIIPGEVVGKVLPIVELKIKKIDNYLRGSPLHLSDVENRIAERIVAGFCGKRFIGCYTVKNSGEIYAVPEFVLT